MGSLLTLRDFKTGRMSSLHFLVASMLRTQPDRDPAEQLSKELKKSATLSVSDAVGVPAPVFEPIK